MQHFKVALELLVPLYIKITKNLGHAKEAKTVM